MLSPASLSSRFPATVGRDPLFARCVRLRSCLIGWQETFGSSQGLALEIRHLTVFLLPAPSTSGIKVAPTSTSDNSFRFVITDPQNGKEVVCQTRQEAARQGWIEKLQSASVEPIMCLNGVASSPGNQSVDLPAQLESGGIAEAALAPGRKHMSSLGLSEGWTQHWSKEKRRFFYRHTKSSMSWWENSVGKETLEQPISIKVGAALTASSSLPFMMQDIGKPWSSSLRNVFLDLRSRQASSLLEDSAAGVALLARPSRRRSTILDESTLAAAGFWPLASRPPTNEDNPAVGGARELGQRDVRFASECFLINESTVVEADFFSPSIPRVGSGRISYI